jgi:hypothetical protein
MWKMSSMRIVLMGIVIFGIACGEKEHTEEKQKNDQLIEPEGTGEIENGFIKLNNSLEGTVQFTGNKSEALILLLQQTGANKKVYTESEELFIKAQHIQRLSENMFGYIVELQARLISEVDEIPLENVYVTHESGDKELMSLHDVVKKDNYDIPTEMLIGDDPMHPKTGAYTARELKEKIHAYRDEMVGLVESMENSQEITAKIKNELTLPETVTEHGNEVPWETGNFSHVPLVAAVTILSSHQATVSNIEADGLSFLLSKVPGSDQASLELSGKDSLIQVGNDTLKVKVAAYE